MKTGLLHHIELYVSDLIKSRNFWEWFLTEIGYSLFQEWDDGFSMKLEETYIVFVQTGSRFKKPSYHRCRTGLNHLAFHIESVSELEKIKSKLEKKCCTFLYMDRYPHAGSTDYHAIFFEDPDRIKVELVCSLV
ncbi:VOC family protein [bacterium]|nr:VOC family protein [bacterium]